MSNKLVRWLPAAILPAAVVVAAVAVPMTADASPNLPKKSAQQLLELVAESSEDSFSGTLEQTSDLGLPELPSGNQFSDASSALELLTGDHKARVFVGAEDQARVQVLDKLAERDIVRNGADVWVYDSDEQEATHLALPDHAASAPTDSVPTPSSLATRFLAALEPTTKVTVEDNAIVAGRSAYVLKLTPTTDDTLVGSVAVSVDAETGLPLGVRVTADGQKDPAFSVEYSSIDFSAPDAERFDFTPPAGTTVEEVAVPTKTAQPSYAGPTPTVSGTGWDAVVELSTGAAGSADPSEQGDLLRQLTTEVDGGRVLQTALVSVLLTDDGRILAGAVPVERLQSVAAQ